MTDKTRRDPTLHVLLPSLTLDLMVLRINSSTLSPLLLLLRSGPHSSKLNPNTPIPRLVRHLALAGRDFDLETLLVGFEDESSASSLAYFGALLLLLLLVGAVG